MNQCICLKQVVLLSLKDLLHFNKLMHRINQDYLEHDKLPHYLELHKILLLHLDKLHLKLLNRHKEVYLDRNQLVHYLEANQQLQQHSQPTHYLVHNPIQRKIISQQVSQINQHLVAFLDNHHYLQILLQPNLQDLVHNHKLQSLLLEELNHQVLDLV